MTHKIVSFGYTNHMTLISYIVFDLEEFDGRKVLMGNNTFYVVKGLIIINI